jgi:galactokinase
MSPRPPSQIIAFAPGRVNLIGEHTDYNDGLSLPFAVAQGVRVSARPCDSDEIVARSLDHDHQARFPLAGSARDPDGGWTEFVRGALAELQRAGHQLSGALIEIAGDVPEGGGLSSSAALEVALALALLASAEITIPRDEHRIELARLCSRVENDWVGARTGLLDQLASLFGEPDHALRIDFRTLAVEPVSLRLSGWRLVVVSSGEEHSLAASSGYEQRRAECEQARLRLELESLRDATTDDVARLPPPLDRRLRHVIEENSRVEEAVEAIQQVDLARLADLLNASHTSLRDLYDASTEAVERTVSRLIERDGAAGARMMGGGFGGHVLALLAPDARIPDDATVVTPSAGARLLNTPE